MMNSHFFARFITVLSLLGAWASFIPAALSGAGRELSGEGKSDSGEVTIDATTAQDLGIKVTPVQRQRLPVEIVATGQIELLPNQKVAITSPIRGKVLQLLVTPSSKVRAGQAVATVISPELADSTASQKKKNEAGASLQRAQTELQLAQESYDRAVQTANIDREQARSQLAAAQARLTRKQQLAKSGVLLQEAKTNHQRQQKISQAEIDAAQYAVNIAKENYRREANALAGGYGTKQKELESRARLAEAEASLAKARKRPELRQAEIELRKAETEIPLRELDAAEKQIAAAQGVHQRSLIAADSQLRKARAAVIAAQQRQIWSATTDSNRIGQLGNIDSQNKVNIIKSPIDGTVADQDIATRQSVIEAGSKIMTITDDRQAVATTNIYAKDLAKVKIGQAATIKVEDKVFNGTVSRIGTVAEGQSREIPVQVGISNSGSSLKSGMRAELKLTAEENIPLKIAIPRGSVVETEDKKIVYVQNENTYQAVNVELGQTVGDLVEVKSGLFVGDQIVTQQAAQIYAQSFQNPADRRDHGHKEGVAKTSTARGWQVPPWGWAIPGTLVTGGGAWWLIKKRQYAYQDNHVEIEDVLEAEIIIENPPRSNVYDFDAEVRTQTDIQIEVTEVEEILEDRVADNDPEANHDPNHQSHNSNHESNGKGQILITPKRNSH
jgi:membrane fusion protein, heavy metal efflux system